VFTGSGSLLLQPSELIESRNEAEAISETGHEVQGPPAVSERPVWGAVEGGVVEVSE
jgi:hypothetical protein